jgi:hypothetical protein
VSIEDTAASSEESPMMTVRQVLRAQIRGVKLIPGAGVVLVGVLASDQIQASDSKVFNGTFCKMRHELLQPPPVVSQDVLYTTSGEVENRTSARREMVCPIIRDNTQNTSGWDHIIVGYVDHHLQEDISCTAFSRGADGTVAFSQTVGETTFTTGTWDTLFIDATAMSEVDGYYHLNCEIPGEDPVGGVSAIAFYRVQEP